MIQDVCATIILARGGSKGVPGKNLRPIGGIPLVARAVRAGIAAKSQSAVYVSTDDSAIAAVAKIHGARIINRPPSLAGDGASSEEGWLHALPIVRQDYPELSRLVFLQCTSPFIDGNDIDSCLSEMTKAQADCALSVVEDHGFLWSLDASNRGIGQNHNHEQRRARRQDLPPQYRENGAIYCVNVKKFEEIGQRFCGSVALCPIDQPILEIDTFADLELAQVLSLNFENSSVTSQDVNKVKALVMDFDGVHTDNSVSTDQHGTESVQTSRGDGMGLSELARRTEVKRLIVSKERNPAVIARADKLGIDVMSAIDDKVAALESWLVANNLQWDDVLYVGNDINDIPPMQKAGLTACPSDAHENVFEFVDWILPQPGGRGALRHLCDTIISVQTTTGPSLASQKPAQQIGDQIKC